MDKLISQQAAIDAIKKRLLKTAFNNVVTKQNVDETLADVAENRLENRFNELPPIQPEPHEIGYSECANAMLKMWIDNVLTDGEYNRIMDKLNAHWAERREK